MGTSGGRNTLYPTNPISNLPSYWEMVSLRGSCNAFKIKAGERDRRRELKKDIAGRQGIAWVIQVPSGTGGHTLTPRRWLGWVGMGRSRDQIPGSLAEGRGVNQ